VIYRRHPRPSTPTSSSLRTQRLCVKFSDSFPQSLFLASHLPYLLPSSVSRKSFACHSYENCRGAYQQFPFWNASAPSEAAGRSSLAAILKFFLFKSLRTLLRSRKTQLVSFQALPNSLPKTTRGGGEGMVSPLTLIGFPSPHPIKSPHRPHHERKRTRQDEATS
jgi:hypothetical protein